MLKQLFIFAVITGTAMSVFAGAYEDAIKKGDSLNQGKNYVKASEVYLSSVDLTEDPKNKAASLYKAAVALLSAKQRDKAIETYRKILKLENIPPETKSSAQLRVGQLLESAKDYEKALAEYQKVSQIEGGHKMHVLGAQYHMARTLGKTGKYDEAIKAYQKVLSDQKSDDTRIAKAHLEIAALYKKMKKYDLAVQEADKVIKQKNGKYVVEALRMIGYTYYSMKDYPKAKEYFKKVIAVPEISPHLKQNAQSMLNKIEAMEK